MAQFFQLKLLQARRRISLSHTQGFSLHKIIRRKDFISCTATPILLEHKKATLEQKLYREQQDKKTKDFQTELREELRKMKTRQDMIKNWQEMIFTKQDQIQSTIHGETKPFQSPPSMVMSPPFTSPTGSLAGLDTMARTYGSASTPEPSLPNVIDDYSSVLDASDYDYDDSIFQSQLAQLY